MTKHSGSWDAEKTSEDLQAWIRTNRPKSTSSTYTTYQKQYLSYCDEKKIPVEHHRDPVVVAQFLKDQFETRNLSRGTLTVVMPAAIADLSRDEKSSPTVSAIVKEVKKTIVRLTKPGKRKLPLPRHILVRMTDMVSRKDPKLKMVRDILMFILMFGGFMRQSEVAALKKGDVWLGEEEGSGGPCVYIFIEKSKTDQERIGETIVLQAGSVGSKLCPVTWFKVYDVMKRKDTTNFFYSVLNRNKKLSAGRPNNLLKDFLKEMGMEGKERESYGSHSLRKGGATRAAAAKIRTHVIKRHGRWLSDAVYIYIVDPVGARLEVSKAVL